MNTTETIYQAALGQDTVEVIMHLGKNPRFELLANGKEFITVPATRRWKSEQRDAIETAQIALGVEVTGKPNAGRTWALAYNAELQVKRIHAAGAVAIGELAVEAMKDYPDAAQVAIVVAKLSELKTELLVIDGEIMAHTFRWSL